MEKLLKYLLPILAVAVFWNCKDITTSSDSGNTVIDSYVYDAISNSTITASDSEFCLPRQVTYANTQQVQGGARRTTSIHRNCIEFAKAGKLINAGTRYFVQRNFIITTSSLTEPSLRLLCLGKLLI